MKLGLLRCARNYTFKRSGVSRVAGSGLLIAGGTGCEPAREKISLFLSQKDFLYAIVYLQLIWGTKDDDFSGEPCA